MQPKRATNPARVDCSVVEMSVLSLGFQKFQMMHNGKDVSDGATNEKMRRSMKQKISEVGLKLLRQYGLLGLVRIEGCFV